MICPSYTPSAYLVFAASMLYSWNVMIILCWLGARQGETCGLVVILPFDLVLLPSAEKFQEPMITQPDSHVWMCSDVF